MYRVNDRVSAIKEIQGYLGAIIVDEPFVAPSGVYDDNTRLAVIKFQEQNGLESDGIVDMITFDLLYAQYRRKIERDKIQRSTNSFVDFPILPGDFTPALAHINKMMSSLLDNYGVTHDLSDGTYYSRAMSEAVKEIRRIYLLEALDLIDEVLYSRMVNDYNSIFKIKPF